MVFVKDLVLLLLYFLLWFAKGDESIGFKLEHIICIDEKVNVTVKCTVPYPINGIKIFLNESEISQCRAFKAPPYKFCKNIMEKAHQNAVAYLLDNSMFYTTEGAYNYIISKTVVCQNGGTNDVKYSLSIPNTICNTTYKDNPLDVVRFVMLMMVVLVACTLYIYQKNGGCPCKAKRSQDPSNAVLTGVKIAVCFISFIVNVVCCTVISEFDMTIAGKIVLSVFCWVLWIVQFFIPTNCTRKNNPS